MVYFEAHLSYSLFATEIIGLETEIMEKNIFFILKESDLIIIIAFSGLEIYEILSFILAQRNSRLETYLSLAFRS